MEDGLIHPASDKYGCMVILPSGHMQLMDIGIIPISAGRGYLILIGAGHLFIMAAGNTILFMAGCGYPATNGHLHGLAGASMMVTMDGLH